jgi:hypothetical protein
LSIQTSSFSALAFSSPPLGFTLLRFSSVSLISVRVDLSNGLPLSSPRWQQKGLLPRFQYTKKKKIQRKNKKSELQGLENTIGWFCIGFAICFLISTVNTGLALWFIFEFVFLCILYF